MDDDGYGDGDEEEDEDVYGYDDGNMIIIAHADVTDCW